jgi:HK97 family phage prohead protease
LFAKKSEAIMEYKSLPMFTKSIEDRTVAGIFAVHGVMDSYQDISYPGSFTKTIAERGSKVKHLWNHDYWGGVPTAAVKSLREVTRDELPADLLAQYPEATGGAEVVREYLDTPKGNELLIAIKASAVDEMSYGYDPMKFDFADVNGVRVRNLRENKLWETSDVLWGANPATAASKLFLPLDMLLKQMEGHLTAIKAGLMPMTPELQALIEAIDGILDTILGEPEDTEPKSASLRGLLRQARNLKSGARHSASDTKLLNAIHNAATELGATNCKGLVDEAQTDEGKSRADELSLTLLRSKLDIFLLENA